MTSLECILDKGSAYTRFRIGIRVMQTILAAAPRPVSAVELEQAAGCSAWLLGRVCSNLMQVDMLAPASGIRNAWAPGPAASGATLADLLCCELRCKAGAQETQQRSALSHRRDMDAFLQQATININQTVLEQLRRFPLRKTMANGITATRTAFDA